MNKGRLKVIIVTAVWISLFASGEAMAATGADIYKQQCAACHGDAGAGDGPMAASLSKAPAGFKGAISRTNIEHAMTPGVVASPGHGAAALITPTELEELINYVDGLSK